VPAHEALESTLAALRRLSAETEARGLPPGLPGEEWRFALDASLLAAERGLATLRFRQSEGSGSPDDRRLAGELAALAGRQSELARRFRNLWLRANRPEGIETAQKLFRDAVRALRRAARSLERR